MSIEMVLKQMRSAPKSIWRDPSKWADAIEAAMREKDAEIEALHEQVQDMIDASGQQCGCGYDKPGDVCLGHWPKYKKQQDKIERLRNFVQIVIDQGGLLSDDQFEEMKNVLEEG